VTKEQQIDSLLQNLKKEVPLSANAAQELGDIGDKKAVEPLIEALKNVGKPGSPRIRYEVIRALAKLGDERAIEPLIIDLKTYEDGKNTVDGLQAFGKSAVKPLIRALNDAPKNHYIAIALGNTQSIEAIPCLNTSLMKGNLATAWALGNIGGRDAIFFLKKALEREDIYIRVSAACALVKNGMAEGKNTLHKILFDDTPTLDFKINSDKKCCKRLAIIGLIQANDIVLSWIKKGVK
jgi:HEAT repeat protein